MPARLDALRDHRVDPRRGGRLRLGDRADLVDPGRWSRPPRLAPEGDDRVGLAGDLPVLAAGEGQQQVDGDRLVGALAVRGDLGAQHRRRHDPELPEAAGLRDRHGQPGARQPAAHPGADDGPLED